MPLLLPPFITTTISKYTIHQPRIDSTSAIYLPSFRYAKGSSLWGQLLTGNRSLSRVRYFTQCQVSFYVYIFIYIYLYIIYIFLLSFSPFQLLLIFFFPFFFLEILASSWDYCVQYGYHGLVQRHFFSHFPDCELVQSGVGVLSRAIDWSIDKSIIPYVSSVLCIVIIIFFF